MVWRLRCSTLPLRPERPQRSQPIGRRQFICFRPYWPANFLVLSLPPLSLFACLAVMQMSISSGMPLKLLRLFCFRPPVPAAPACLAVNQLHASPDNIACGALLIRNSNSGPRQLAALSPILIDLLAQAWRHLPGPPGQSNHSLSRFTLHLQAN